jgi:hypothetical protein
MRNSFIPTKTKEALGRENRMLVDRLYRESNWVLFFLFLSVLGWGAFLVTLFILLS